MKRLRVAVILLAGVFAGISVGVSGRVLRFLQVNQLMLRAEYRRGFVAGEQKVYGEAIRHGHGGWSLDANDGKVFAWNDGHPNWTPDRPQTEPIDRVFKE